MDRPMPCNAAGRHSFLARAVICRKLKSFFFIFFYPRFSSWLCSPVLNQVKLFHFFFAEFMIAFAGHDDLRNEHIDRTFGNVLTFVAASPEAPIDAFTSSGETARSRRHCRGG
jgi:hypothetical protein